MHYRFVQIVNRRKLAHLLALTLALVLPVVSLAQAIPVVLSQDTTNRNGLVRIKLSSLGSQDTVDLTLKGTYWVNGGQVSLPEGAQVRVTCNESDGQLTLISSGQQWNMGEYFTLNRGHIDDSVIISQAGHSNPYPADFSFYLTKKGGSYVLLPIAHVQVEDYLYGVLPYGMGNSWPIEALKAQAVAARTYTLRMMDERSVKQYDVVDTSADQVYKGTPSGFSNCKKAIDATKGIVLKYGSRYAETYYSSSNGGQTESASNIWGSNGYDYLCVTDDPYDAASQSAKYKTITINKDLSHGSHSSSLIKLLKEKAVACLKQNGYAATLSNTQLIWLENVSLHTPKYATPSKLYTKVDFIITVETIAGNGSSVKTSVIVSADIFKELEALLNMSLQSASNELWQVVSSDTAFSLKAGRYGHGVGMSQYGAMEMARQGFAYDSILGFYYPGCTSVRLNLSDQPMDEAGSTVLPEIPKDEQPPIGSEEDTPTTPDESVPDIRDAIVIANGFLNLRQSPSLDAPIMEVAMEGDHVRILSDDGKWAKVEYNNIQAYALLRLLLEAEDDVSDSIPAASQQPQTVPTNPAPETGTAQAMVFCSNGFVNFRETPDRSGRVLMQIPHGAYLDVLDSPDEFTHVSYLGVEGYVMTSFLISCSAINPEIPPAMDEPSPATTAALPMATPAPTEAPPSLETTFAPVETPVVIQTDYHTAIVSTKRGSLNLRELPYDHANVLFQIPQYAQVKAQAINPEWCKVQYNGMDGYVMSRFLSVMDEPIPTIEPPAVTPEAEQYKRVGQATVVTQRGSLNLRMQPSSGGKILRTLQPGTVVDVYQIDGQWAFISYRDYSGYVMVSYLLMNQAIPETTEQPLPEATCVPTTPMPVEQEESYPAPTMTEAAVKSEDDPQPSGLPDGFVPTNATIAVAGAGHASFRVLPSMNERVLFLIPANERFEVLACSEEWCYGVWEGWTGYTKLNEIALYTPEMLP